MMHTNRMYKHMIKGAVPNNEDMLTRLQLDNENKNYPRNVVSVADMPPTPAGRLYSVWGRTFKSVCRVHRNCTLMVNTKWFDSPWSAEVASYEWLARARLTTQNGHETEAQQLLQSVRPN